MTFDLLQHLNLPPLEGDMADAFPAVDPGVYPLGTRVMLQIRSVKQQTEGGIFLPSETTSSEQWNTQVARVIAAGPLAFCNRSTGQPWPEGSWVSPGEFVRIPRWGGDRWERKIEGKDEPALFVIFEDRELIGKVMGDPTDFKAYIL